MRWVHPFEKHRHYLDLVSMNEAYYSWPKRGFGDSLKPKKGNKKVNKQSAKRSSE